MNQNKPTVEGTDGQSLDRPLPFMFAFRDQVLFDLSSGLGTATEYSTSSAGRESGYDPDP